jgi:hypothetical protein
LLNAFIIVSMVAYIVERLSGRKVACPIFGSLSKESQGGSHFEVEALGEFTLQGFSPTNSLFQRREVCPDGAERSARTTAVGIYLPDDPEEFSGE